MQFNFDDGWGDDSGFFPQPPVSVPDPVPVPQQQQQQPQPSPQQQPQQTQPSTADPQPPPQAYNAPLVVDPLGCQDGWGPSTSAFGQSLDQPYQAPYSGQPQPTYAGAETFVEPPVQTEKKDVEPVEEVQQKQVEQQQPSKQQSFQKSPNIRGTSSQNNGGWAQPLQKRAPKPSQPAPRMEAEPLDDQSVAGLRNIVQELIGRVQALENERYLIQNTICTLNSNGNTHGRMNFNEKIVEKISWGNDSHIMAPEKGMILNNDKTVLTIEHAGIYHIVFNTLGKNPKIVIDGNIFAGAKSDKSSAVVDFIVSLGSNAKICAVVEQKSTSEATDTWLCVRLLSVYATM